MSNVESDHERIVRLEMRVKWLENELAGAGKVFAQAAEWFASAGKNEVFMQQVRREDLPKHDDIKTFRTSLNENEKRVLA